MGIVLVARDRARFAVRTNTNHANHARPVRILLRSPQWIDAMQGITGASVVDSDYRAPWWLPGGHLQTIYARTLAKYVDLKYRRERWETGDGDFIDLDWIDADQDDAKLLVLFHGLEGCSRSHYALALMSMARRRGWRGVVPHFRGCSGEPNRLARCYHSGDAEEIDWILRRLKERYRSAEIFTLGVSLGGNMLLKWLGEQGENASTIIRRAVGVSVPVDLMAAASELDRGMKKRIYTRSFLQPLRRKVVGKITAHQLPLDPRQVRRASTFREFDNLYTAPVHGFKDAEDYWARASSKAWLKQIKVPTLLVHALNDPFFPAAALPRPDEVSNAVTLDYPVTGGHVGFVSGGFPGNLDWLTRRVLDFLNTEPVSHVERRDF
jgi:predicted alpha/beta-fold hydrolase